MAAARTTGILLGLLALLLLFFLAQPKGREPSLGASVSVVVAEPGELSLDRQDPLPVLSGPNLRQGSVLAGQLMASNITDRQLRVGFVLLPGSGSSSTAAGQVWLKVSQGEETLAQSNVPGLARGSRTIPLAPGESAKFRFESWVNTDDPGLFAGREVSVRLKAIAVPVAEKVP